MADCPFQWGDGTWGAGDLQAFKDWLADHGANYDQWASDHPDADACLKGQAGPSSSALPPVPAAAATIAQLEGPPVPASQQPAVEAAAASALAATPSSPIEAPPYLTLEPGGTVQPSPPASPVTEIPSTPQAIPAAPTITPAPLTATALGAQITWTHDQLEGLWVAAGGDPAEADTAAAIAQAESGEGTELAHSDAVNNTAYPNLPDYHPVTPPNLPEYSLGLWQINIYAHTEYTAAEMFDPAQNAVAAVKLRNARGNFGDWSTYNDGAYLTHKTGAYTPAAQGPLTAPPVPSTPATSATPAGIGAAWNSVLNVFAENPAQEKSNNEAIIDSIQEAIQ